MMRGDASPAVFDAFKQKAGHCSGIFPTHRPHICSVTRTSSAIILGGRRDLASKVFGYLSLQDAFHGVLKIRRSNGVRTTIQKETVSLWVVISNIERGCVPGLRRS